MSAPTSGASQNAHNCASAQPCWISAGPVERAGADRGVRDRDRCQVDDHQGEPDRQTPEAHWRADIGRADDDVDEHSDQHPFDQ
jgi:hypothetical protein